MKRSIVALVRAPGLGIGIIGGAVCGTAICVIISHAVGLMLLPVFVVFEESDWRG